MGDGFETFDGFSRGWIPAAGAEPKVVAAKRRKRRRVVCRCVRLVCFGQSCCWFGILQLSGRFTVDGRRVCRTLGGNGLQRVDRVHGRSIFMMRECLVLS